MHELSIAMNIVEIAEEHCRKHQGQSVSSVRIELGLLSGVVLEALEFALESAKSGSLLEFASFQFDTIPGFAYCSECSLEFETEEYMNSCPGCGSFKTTISRGKELKVKSLQIT